jgi:hypothetical protein
VKDNEEKATRRRRNEMSEPMSRKRFRVALKRLMQEIDNLRTQQAAIAAYQEMQPPRNRFLSTAFVGLHSDRLLRLMRIFENNPSRVASFWYLHRCAPKHLRNLDIEWLRDFSGKLKTVRDRIFVHMDKEGIFDPVTIWREAGLEERDMIRAMETVRPVLNNLCIKEFGKPPITLPDEDAGPDSYNPDLAGLKRLLKESLAQLSGRQSR